VPNGPTLRGVVADPTGALVPGAEIDLLDANGTVSIQGHSEGDGSFLLRAPHAGTYTLVVSEPGFETIKTPVVLAAPAVAVKSAGPAMLHVVLPIASFATSVQVSADSNQDMTAPEANPDSSVMTAGDLKALPLFDNDYTTAMSAFLDSSATATGGSGLVVDGVESNRSTVSASAVQEVQINQDPYSAQYYWPGRGQMEIITKAASENYHGQFNFLFRNSAMNAQNAFATTKPYEQRQNYEGSATGPIPHLNKSGFLVSANRVIHDQDAIVKATISDPSNPGQPLALNANVTAPSRDTEFSLRGSRLFGQKHSAYGEYSYEDWTGRNQGVGGQTIGAAGYNSEYREDDVTLHADSTFSATLLNQISLVAEHDSNRNRNAAESPRVVVEGDFAGGSAQTDSFSSAYNLRLSQRMTWTHGRHLLKAGAGIPNLNRRAYDDETNALGTYTYGPTTDSSGNVLKTALQNYAAKLPSAYSLNSGETHFIYHQQEMGAFIQDQYKPWARFSITPGLRYDWQNFMATHRLGFSPRLSLAWVLDEDSGLVARGGGGIYYDRVGSSPILDLTRYESARRRSVQVSLNPDSLPSSGCMPITNCITVGSQPPAITRLASNAKIPYQIQYGLSIERRLGEKATGIVSVYSARGIDNYRSVDVNAPTAKSGYTTRPNASYGRIREMQSAGFWQGAGLDISYRGRLNKYFTGFGRYTWSHYDGNSNGLGWFPQDQADPNDEWARASWDRRQRLSLYASLNPEGLLNLSAGIFANTGSPWTILTGTDPYGDDLFNARPTGVARNSETMPDYVDLDLRWGHDFHITPNKDEEAPKLGFSAGAFNLLNHMNPSGIDTIENTTDFGQPTSANPPRRIQLGMRFEF
jgi:hypothetical protein